MYNIIESYTEGKSPTVPNEDALVATDSFVAVIDGATPKTSFRFPDNETPGHYAARIIASTIKGLPYDLDAYTCTRVLNEALHTDLPPSDRPIASVVIYSVHRKEVWQIGDCQWASVNADGGLSVHRNDKLIDRQLSRWRSMMLQSMLQREVLSANEVMTLDPARKIIQPFITRQVRYQNTTGNPLSFGVIDGTTTPGEHIHIYNNVGDAKELILASDGYPTIAPTLSECEHLLAEVLKNDPLCIYTNPQTKGIKSGNTSFDDRTLIRIDIQ